MSLITFSFILLLALIVRYTLNFGFSMLFVPLYTLLDNFIDAVSLSIVFEIFIGVLVTIRLRKNLNLLKLMELKLYAIFGAYVGILLLKLFDDHDALVVFSMTLVILSCIVFLIHDIKLPINRTTTSITGISSGILNTFTSISGAPVVLYFYHSNYSKKWIQGSLAGYFLILYLFTFIFRYTGSEHYNSINILFIQVGLLLILLYHFFISIKLKEFEIAHLKKYSLYFISMISFIIIVNTLIH